MLCDNPPFAAFFVIICKSPVRDDCKSHSRRLLGSTIEEGVLKHEVETATLTTSCLSQTLNQGTQPSIPSIGSIVGFFLGTRGATTSGFFLFLGLVVGVVLEGISIIAAVPFRARLCVCVCIYVYM